MKRLTIILILSFTVHAYAQSQLSSTTVSHLNPDSCVALALRNQAAVKNAVLDLSAARETRRAALTKYFPSLSVMAGYFHAHHPLIDVTASENKDNINVSAAFDGRPISLDENEQRLQQALDNLRLDVDVAELVNWFIDRISVDAQLQMLDHGYFANATLMQPVFAGGRIINGNKLAKLGVQAAELQLLMTRDEVEMNVYTLYWNIVSLHEKQKTLRQVQLMLDTLERDAAAAVVAGVTSRNDLLKVQIKQSELEVAGMQLADGLELATRALCQYMGVGYDSVCYTFDTLSLHDSDIPAPLPYVDLAAAVARRNESRLLKIGCDAARLQKRMTIGETLPQVAVGATYGYNNLTHDQMQANGLVFATLNIPVTAWWETAHNLRKEEFMRQKAENTRRDLQEKLVLQTFQSWSAMNESYSLISVRRRAVNQASENFTEVKNYFDAGMNSMKDYLEAQTLLQQARNELVNQVIDYLLQRRQYSLLM